MSIRRYIVGDEHPAAVLSALLLPSAWLFVRGSVERVRDEVRIVEYKLEKSKSLLKSHNTNRMITV